MRRSILTLCLTVAASAALLALSAGGAGAASGDRAGASPNEVLSIENGNGVFRVTGRGTLIMRITQGTVVVVDQTPADRFSPYLGGVPRGRSSSAGGRDINLYVLGGRYKVTVRGSGINISARGDGTVLLQGVPDSTGDAGTIRVGDLVRPIAEGEAKAGFGTYATPDPSSSASPGSSSSTSGSSSPSGAGSPGSGRS